MTETYFLPEINLIIMSITTVLYTIGCLIYGNKNLNKKLHFKLSLAGWISTLAFFMIYMLQRSLVGGLTAPGYTHWFYYPFLYTHMITATIVLILPLYLLYLGLKQRKGKTEKSMKTLGNINVLLWYLTFISGIVVYIALNVLR